MAAIVIDVLGVPASKGNPRAYVHKKTGKAVLASFGFGKTSDKLRGWDACVRERARAAVGAVAAIPFVDTHLAVTLIFRIARPAGHWSKNKKRPGLLPSSPEMPRGKPDIDKLARSTLDALTGVVFDDDARIVLLVAIKEYAAPGDEGARIVVDEWSPS